ncbi:hypothetical protein Tco_1312763 [Tanacetum coccineum]
MALEISIHGIFVLLEELWMIPLPLFLDASGRERGDEKGSLIEVNVLAWKVRWSVYPARLKLGSAEVDLIPSILCHVGIRLKTTTCISFGCSVSSEFSGNISHVECGLLGT